MVTDPLKLTEKWPVLAIIGCGAITESFYLPTLQQYPELLGRLILVDANLERVRKLAAQVHVANLVSDYRDIVGSVDGVIVAVPHYLHYSISTDFLAAGAHVLCEKPLAETGAEAREMIRLAKENSVTISVNHGRRLFPSSQKVKQLLLAGEIGKPLTIRYLDGDVFKWPTFSGFYFDSKLSNKGVLLDIGAHVLDLICWWLGGKPRLVSSENDSFGGCEAVASILFEYEECKGEIRLSRLAKLPNYFEIRGDRGSIEGGTYNWKKIIVTSKQGKRKEIRLSPREGHSFDFGRQLIGNFLDVLRERGQPLIPATQILNSVDLLEEAYSMSKRFSMPWYNIVDLIHET
jgi:predicted dehydrogenase